MHADASEGPHTARAGGGQTQLQCLQHSFSLQLDTPSQGRASTTPQDSFIRPSHFKRCSTRPPWVLALVQLGWTADSGLIEPASHTWEKVVAQYRCLQFLDACSPRSVLNIIRCF